MDNEDMPQVVPDLIWRVLDQETVVVSPVNGKYCVLNGLGTVIWQLLVEKCSVMDIEDHLVAQYEVSRDQAREDVFHFLSRFTAAGVAGMGCLSYVYEEVVAVCFYFWWGFYFVVAALCDGPNPTGNDRFPNSHDGR